MKKVDIIIPCYNARATLDRCLCSIACQTVSDEIFVTLVDDCSTDCAYEDFIGKYAGVLDIQVIRLEQNGGPGVARQRGIDETHSPYFMCVDADDTLAGAYAVSMLVDTIAADNRNVLCAGCFDEELKNGEFKRHKQDLVWMFGKIYRRSFIDEYGIRFHRTSRYNEDNGFNTSIRLVADESHRIVYIEDMVYYWQRNESSITRKNDNAYTYDKCFVGYVENQLYALSYAASRHGITDYATNWANQVFCYLYAYFVECLERSPKNAKQNWGCCSEFYRSTCESYLLEGEFHNIGSSVMAAVSNNMAGVLPIITFWDWLRLLKSGVTPDWDKYLEEVERCKTICKT